MDLIGDSLYSTYTPTPPNVNPKDILLIDIGKYGKWSNFIDQILSCEAILSSSLHGLIVSDAYHVPNLWVSFKEATAPYANFKYEDYYLSVNKPQIKTPVQYCELEKNTDILSFILNSWTTPTINLEPLINACPFKFKQCI
jgi:pyruvyltransferase